eukprot:1423421-Alexandrium_andersonii.AAC.1
MGLGPCEDFEQVSSSGPSKISVANSGILDPFFWAWLEMMECLATPLRRVEAFVDSCPCHWSLIADFKDVGPAELISLWKSCPMKGMNVPEVSAGQLGEIL